MFVAGGIGAASGWVGSTLSAMAARLPAGAIIVLAAGGFFLISMLFGSRRGLVRSLWKSLSLRRRVQRQHLLRAMHECGGEANMVTAAALVAVRTWTPRHVSIALRRGQRKGEVRPVDGGWALTKMGQAGARQIVRNHRLWELFLIHYADIAPSHVDRDADLVEHVLDAPLVAQLEALLKASGDVPDSPHAIGVVGP
jgi:manganese/zinc/iron transport system permease protein